MASGAKPYAPALANLGYLAWQSGNNANAESMFNRSVQADPLIGSIFARINLAQIMRAGVDAREGAEANEEALAELVEFVRVGVQVVFEELGAMRQPAPPPGVSLH